MKKLLFILITCLGLSSVQAQNLVPTLNKIKDHISSDAILNASQLVTEKNRIVNNASNFQTDTDAIALAFEVVELYDNTYGALFTRGTSTNGGINPRGASGFALENAIIEIMQGVIDYGYTESNLKNNPSIFNNALFATSNFFPGSASPPTDSNVSYIVKINGKHVRVIGTPYNYEDQDARRPTGCYLAPGSVATVTVPASLVGIGASILVGAHTWDNSIRPNRKRLDRVTKKYPITSTTVTIGNPLGGGIYVNVPFQQNLGTLNITLKNVIRSPYFANTSVNQTSASEWRGTQRGLDAPWTDFETDKVMFQVPTSWIYNTNDPSTVLNDWDDSMDAISDLLGRPQVRSKTVVYAQVDLQFRGTAFFPGYPQANVVYDPNRDYGGNFNNYLVRGPRGDSSNGAAVFFHELGHAEKIYKFKGEIEAFVNFLYVPVHNKKFGVDLDRAFINSSTTTEHTIDEAAISWMIAENFRLGNPMSTQTGQFRQEFSYQTRGYAKYADIVRIFGWEALENFYKQLSDDYDSGIYNYRGNVNTDPTDDRILRMSVAAGYDLRPLLHFWGIQPERPEILLTNINQSGVSQSAEIYDQLERYKELVPMDNEAFRAFGLNDYSQGSINSASTANRSNVAQTYGQSFLRKFWSSYGEEEGQAAIDEIQNIMDLYFPNGRPTTSQNFTPDPDKKYYLDVPAHNLRLAADGAGEDAYTTSTNTTGADVEWQFVDNGNGSWHLDRAAGGLKPRLRTDNSINADMQQATFSGTYTYFNIAEGTTSNTYFLTLPDGPSNFGRLQINSSGVVRMVSKNNDGSWESFIISEVPSSPAVFPNPNKLYYIDSPVHNLRIAADGSSNEPYTTSTSTRGADVEWQFVDNGEGYWHIDRAAGGNSPRLRSRNSADADMQATSSSGSYTYYEPTVGAISGTYFMTLPNGPGDFVRLQVNNSGSVKMVPVSNEGTWESLLISEVPGSTVLQANIQNLNEEEQIIVHPNPVASSLNVQVPTEGEDVVLSIVDSTGLTVRENNYKTEKGLNLLQVNTEGLTSGLYIVHILKNGTTITKKLLVE